MEKSNNRGSRAKKYIKNGLIIGTLVTSFVATAFGIGKSQGRQDAEAALIYKTHPNTITQEVSAEEAQTLQENKEENEVFAIVDEQEQTHEEEKTQNFDGPDPNKKGQNPSEQNSGSKPPVDNSKSGNTQSGNAQSSNTQSGNAVAEAEASTQSETAQSGNAQSEATTQSETATQAESGVAEAKTSTQSENETKGTNIGSPVEKNEESSPNPTKTQNTNNNQQESIKKGNAPISTAQGQLEANQENQIEETNKKITNNDVKNDIIEKIVETKTQTEFASNEVSDPVNIFFNLQHIERILSIDNIEASYSKLLSFAEIIVNDLPESDVKDDLTNFFKNSKGSAKKTVNELQQKISNIKPELQKQIDADGDQNVKITKDSDAFQKSEQFDKLTGSKTGVFKDLIDTIIFPGLPKADESNLVGAFADISNKYSHKNYKKLATSILKYDSNVKDIKNNVDLLKFAQNKINQIIDIDNNIITDKEKVDLIDNFIQICIPKGVITKELQEATNSGDLTKISDGINALNLANLAEEDIDINQTMDTLSSLACDLHMQNALSDCALVTAHLLRTSGVDDTEFNKIWKESDNFLDGVKSIYIENDCKLVIKSTDDNQVSTLSIIQPGTEPETEPGTEPETEPETEPGTKPKPDSNLPPAANHTEAPALGQ